MADDDMICKHCRKRIHRAGSWADGAPRFTHDGENGLAAATCSQRVEPHSWGYVYCLGMQAGTCAIYAEGGNWCPAKCEQNPS